MPENKYPLPLTAQSNLKVAARHPIIEPFCDIQVIQRKAQGSKRQTNIGYRLTVKTAQKHRQILLILYLLVKANRVATNLGTDAMRYIQATSTKCNQLLTHAPSLVSPNTLW